MNKKLNKINSNTKCVIYARSSRQPQYNAQDDIYDQIINMQIFAVRSNLEIVAIFQDTTSASHCNPGIQSMLAFMESSGVDTILCLSLERLLRRRWEVIFGKSYIKMIVTPSFTIKLEEPEGKFFASMTMAMRQYYLNNHAEIIKRGFLYKKQLRHGING